MFQLTRRARAIDIWPGFVDALASVLIVFIFMLLVFVLAQFYATWELAGREATISRLERSIDELARTLSLERERGTELQTQLAEVELRLRATLAERDALFGRLTGAEGQLNLTQAELEEANRTIKADRETIEARLAEIAGLQQDIAVLRELRSKLESEVAQRDTALDEGRRLTERAERRVAELTRQIQALREQLAAVSQALELEQAKVKDQRVEIAKLGERLNLALARRVQELNRYRSEFFGRLREALGDRPDIRIVGDRFVFQSEVLFDSASADLGPAGEEQIRRVARTLNEVSKKIPRDLDWVLRIDGHTDRRSIHTSEFPSNWELSTARALSIVRLLTAEGVPPQRLIAAGFGEYRPIDPGSTPAAWQKNRRIEIRFTSP
ncbi:MAG: peptidoglycan -binding protein [bacterium]|jgi:chemotaxis protein MotB